MTYKGFQHKVCKDDLIIVDDISLNPGDNLIIDKVLLIGTPAFTAVGRPFVENAKVLCRVEENTLTDKVIIFKKKRRQGYQRNKGHRQQVSMIRVNKVIYDPSPDVLENYKSLI